jgi:hemerythrin
MSKTTAVFQWTEAYSVNIAALDRQHQGLFDTINELNSALAGGQGAKAMDSVLRKLAQYATIHFAAEEVLMEEYGFPKLTLHRKEHEAFRQNVAKYLDDYKNDKTGAPVSLLLFLQSWLREHILKSDKAYSSFLNAHGVR